MVMQTRSSASSESGSSLSAPVDTERRGAFATNKVGRKSNHRKFSSSNKRTPQSPPIGHHRQEEEEEEEPIEKFLEALEKNSLAVLVKEAISKYGDPNYIDGIRKVADEDSALRKIRVEVVGHAYFDAKTLTSVFESHGEIEQFSFVPNPHASFVTVVSATADILFKHRYGARTVLRMPHIKLGEGVYAITKLHSLLGPGQFWNPLTWSPYFCSRALTGHPPLVVEEPGEKLVDFFGKSYLVGLVMEAISKHPDFVQSVKTQASLDPTCRRLRVTCKNLPHSLTSITSFYGKYGEIEECTANRTSATILYKHRNSVCKALKQPRSDIAIGLRAWCRPGPEVVGRQLWRSTGAGRLRIPSQPGRMERWVASCLQLDKLKDKASGVTEISIEDRLKVDIIPTPGRAVLVHADPNDLGRGMVLQKGYSRYCSTSSSCNLAVPESGHHSHTGEGSSRACSRVF